MRPVTQSLLIAALLLGSALPAQSDADRSAAIKQVTKSAAMSERSSAALDQISTVATGRTRLDQIDPAAALDTNMDGDHLNTAPTATPDDGCTLSPEQQSIVTSLEAQGKLPAGDCEMVSWFAQPRDKDEVESRQSLAESVVASAPELLGRSAEADRLAKLEADMARADAAAAAAALSLLAPPPIPPGK